MDSLLRLSESGTVVIYSLRLSPLSFDCSAQLPREEVIERYYDVRQKLDNEGLQAVLVWPHWYGKPPGKVIIDDRAIHFRNWPDTMALVRAREGF